MKYGCIGERLGHSFSKEIHNTLASYEYELCEVEKHKLDEFMQKRDFAAINVTIPYKEAVIPHLYYISEAAGAIGAVNTVVNREGKLYGYNTDHYGMTNLIDHAKLDLKNKKVAILGTGGTSKTAQTVAYDKGSREVIKISRAKKNGVFTYEELYKYHSDTEIIINTTPVGMYPRSDESPVELDKFNNLCGVVDAVYNPIRTKLVMEAKKRGVKAEGGLYMLVAQAIQASQIFIDTKYSPETTEKVFKKILSQKENIVLVGMPGSGKSTVGRLLSEKLNRPFYDTDDLITKKTGKPITEIFSEVGEDGFRNIEESVIKELSLSVSGAVISTGGGAILREKNVDVLRQNGRLYFLDRPFEELIPTDDRPLANTVEAIKKRYEERYPLYNSICDKKIECQASPEEIAGQIILEHTK